MSEQQNDPVEEPQLTPSFRSKTGQFAVSPGRMRDYKQRAVDIRKRMTKQLKKLQAAKDRAVRELETIKVRRPRGGDRFPINLIAKIHGDQDRVPRVNSLVEAIACLGGDILLSCMPSTVKNERVENWLVRVNGVKILWGGDYATSISGNGTTPRGAMLAAWNMCLDRTLVHERSYRFVFAERPGEEPNATPVLDPGHRNPSGPEPR